MKVTGNSEAIVDTRARLKALLEPIIPFFEGAADASGMEFRKYTNRSCTLDLYWNSETGVIRTIIGVSLDENWRDFEYGPDLEQMATVLVRRVVNRAPSSR